LPSAGSCPGHFRVSLFEGLAGQAVQPNIPAVSGEYKRPVNGLPDCLNHERFIL